MFCSRKKSASSPCSCAFLLQSPVAAVLGHLCGLGKGTLVMKQAGLSIAKSTGFGPAVSFRENGWHILRDRVSGLETDAGRQQNIYLLSTATGHRPLLAMGVPGQPVDLTIRLDGHDWDSTAIREMMDSCSGIPLDCVESRRLGAGDWLDDWGEPWKRAGEGDLVMEAHRAMHGCRMLEIVIRTAAHRNVTRFKPTFVDSEGSVLRIADRDCNHVVYADVEAPDFRLISDSSSHVRIYRDKSETLIPSALNTPAA